MAMDMDVMLTELIVSSGDARSHAMEALQAARKGDMETADKLIATADEVVLAAHGAQTDIIQAELNGEGVPVNLMAVHAQDHLMNALTVIDLAKEIIEICRERK